jgi:hypothetical protein
MEKDLSHQIDVDGEILLGGMDGVVAQHLFDLVNRVAQVEKVLGIGVTKRVGGGSKTCSVHGF